MAEDLSREYKDVVLREFQQVREAIKDLSGKVDDLIKEDITQMKVDIGMLKVKCALLGAGSGSIVALVIQYLGKH